MTIQVGSFRDRTARVFVSDGRILRTLTSEAWDAWKRVSQQEFFCRMTSDGRIVGTRQITPDEIIDSELPEGFVAALQHDPVPFISYPYEWSFEMLKRAALLHLEILLEATKVGFILKDASPFNVQFRGSRPVFIDIASFVALVPGEPWSAYRQFCEMMLFPLLLQAHRHIDFQALLRSQLEGISAGQFMKWLSLRDLIRPGVFTHGWLQACLERHTKSIQTSTVRDLRESGFHTDLIRSNLIKLQRLIERLCWKPATTQWTNYREAEPHVLRDGEVKSEFVRQVCRARLRTLVWDLGCNDGRFSRIAADHATTVVAMDSDHGCVDRLFRSLTQDQSQRILPLCIDLANPSPSQGWRGRERSRLEDRGQPDLVLCLGLIHHLVIGSNIPLMEVVDWLASLNADVVLEFPTKEDAMVRGLLRNKHDQYSDYSQEALEEAVEQHFTVQRREHLPSGNRLMLHLVPRP